MYLAGHRMLDFVGLVPLAGTLGYGVAIVSYNQSLYFGAMAEPRLMPDVEFMKSCQEKEKALRLSKAKLGSGTFWSYVNSPETLVG